MYKPPLDPRSLSWFPITHAVDERTRQTGDLGAAFLDLQRDLANGLDCMRWNRVSNKCEHVDASEWKPDLSGLSLDPVPIKKVTQKVADIYHRKGSDGWSYYVWKPRFDRLYYVWPDLKAIRSPPAVSAPVDQDDARDRPQEPTPQQRKQREPGGAPAKFKPEQQQWLREQYSSDLIANPRLAKHDGAVPHVKGLAKTKYGIDAGRNTLLQQIIRPVLRAAKNNQ